MLVNRLPLFACIALAGLLAVAPGCGGGTDTDYGYGPIQILSVSDDEICGPTPTAIVIGGLDFSEIVGDGTEGLPVPECKVTFIAVSPIFLGGTTDRVDVYGQVLSRTQISVTTPPAVICGPAAVAARVRVTLPSGVFATSGNILSFLAPTLAGFIGASVFPAAIPTPFTIDVDGDCSLTAFAGQTVHVHWQTNAGVPNLFGGPTAGPAANPQIGTSDDIVTPATINALGNIEGISPLAVVCQPGAVAPLVFAATIDRVNFPDGSCSPGGTALATGFRAPQMTSVTNDAPGSPYLGTNQFAAAIPEAFFVTGADFGPDGSPVQVVFREAAGAAIFEGGTSAETIVIGTITSPTRIDGISPPASICGLLPSVSVNVSVVLPGGSCTPNTAPSTFFPPTFTSIGNIETGFWVPPAGPSTFFSTMPARFRVTGTDFGPNGGTVAVVFTAANPIFEGGTLPGTHVNATILSRGLAEGVTPEALICQPLTTGIAGEQAFFEPVGIQLILEGGSCSLASPGVTTFYGPGLYNFGAIVGNQAFAGAAPVSVPSTLPLCVDEKGIFTLTGAGFGPPGTNAVVTFTADSGNTVFPGGVVSWDVPGTVFAPNVITGRLPTIAGRTVPGEVVGPAARLVADELMDVSVRLINNGSCVHNGQMVNYVAPPTVTGVASTEAGTGNGFLVTLGASEFLGCVASGATLTGTGFLVGPPSAETYIYDPAAGLDGNCIPVRRLGQDPWLGPLGSDLGLPAGPGAPLYTVTATTIDGLTRMDELLAELDTDRDGFVRLTIRVINPSDSQYHDFVFQGGWRTASDAVNVSNNGTAAFNNVEVTIDPMSIADDFADGTAAPSPDGVNGGNAVICSSFDDLTLQGSFANGIGLWFTNDGGRNFLPGTAPTAADDGAVGPGDIRSFPTVRFDPWGNLWLTYRLDDPGVDFDGPGPGVGQSSIVMAWSADLGVTWTATVVYSASLANLDRPSLATGWSSPTLPGEAQALAAFVDYQPNLLGGPETIEGALASMVGLGAVLSPPIPYQFVFGSIPDSGGIGFPVVAQDARTAAGPDGTWVVSWTEADVLAQTSSVYFNYNLDGPWPAGPAFGAAAVLVASQPAYQGVPAQPLATYPGHDVAIVEAGTDAGRVVFAYEALAAVDPNVPQHKNVVTVYTDDFGVTLSAPEVVHVTAASDQFLPAITCDAATGRMYVTWYDTELDSAVFGGGDVRAERMLAVSDDGATWGDAFTLSQGPSDATQNFPPTYDYGDRGGSVAAWHGCILCGWADNSNGPGVQEMEAFVRLVQWTAAVLP